MPNHADLLEVFAGTVARRASHVAVESPEGTLTYGELDKRSNQLANRLRSLGVENESRVGISLPRGALELLTMLATVKAGGAYVPLDPSHPEDRLRGILKDAEPQVMVVHPGSALASASEGHTLILDSIDGATNGQDRTPLVTQVTPSQLVYILFTSGSTGRPKGVEITRGALANFLGSMARTPGMAEHERLLAITTTAFDIAGLELFLPLCVGATTVIVDRESARDPRKLRQRLEKGDITLMQATPATWRLLLEAGWCGDGKLRMICGGEALSPTLANRLLTAGGELWNGYGPTETTVYSSLEPIIPGYDRITIGKPIDETQLYIFDQAMRRVAMGQEGEIWIGGKGLARGYTGRPDLTAERFVQNPNGPDGDRIYRTGDLGRRLADDRFECLGRLDHQVKIQGFRIELGEIETVLRAVPGVREALVIADRRQDGHARLLAYWVGPAERETLIKAAQHKLPAYMVPAAFVPLHFFPLNTNGKIDFKRLPKPEIALLAKSSATRPPTETETRIVDVWSQVLGSVQVPIDQSFFTLGGTSALALTVIARVEQELGVEIPLQAFFATPTVEGIAANIGKTFSPDAPIVARLRQGNPETAPLFCLFGVTIYQDLAFELADNRPVFGLHVPIRYVPGCTPCPTLQQIGENYVELIRRHQSRGPYHLLGLCFGGIVAYEVASQLQAMGESVAAVIVIDAVLPTAIQVDWGKRLMGLALGAWKRPGTFSHKLRERLDQLCARSSLRGIFQGRKQLEQASHAVDLDINGPEADTAAKCLAAQAGKLPTRLLVVRATKEPWPEWVTVAPDQGWGGRAEAVLVRDVAANHLGVLREPHVRTLAQAIEEVFQA
jgi:amino acid adenylation domain-containing protein